MYNSASAAENSDALRYFTAGEANAMLPLVKVIVRDISQLANDLVDRKTRLAAIRAGSSHRVDVYADELDQAEKSIDSDKYRLQELLEELCDLGVHPHEPLKGIVAFPTLVDGTPSYLIWKTGDSEVCPMENLGQDFADVQPLESLFEQS